jgi:hypothetical protein
MAQFCRYDLPLEADGIASVARRFTAWGDGGCQLLG